MKQPLETLVEFSSEWFTASSKAWAANKVKRPNGCYAYRCLARIRGGHQCRFAAYKTTQVCWRHRSKNIATT